MQGQPLPESDHIARYCGGASVYEDGSIDGSAFRLKRKGGAWEEYLSVNWLEFLGTDNRTEQLVALRAVLTQKGFKLGATSRFAVHGVGALRDYVRYKSPEATDLSVRHEPFDDDQSHSSIYGLRPEEDDLISDLIAEAVEELLPGKA